MRFYSDFSDSVDVASFSSKQRIGCCIRLRSFAVCNAAHQKQTINHSYSAKITAAAIKIHVALSIYSTIRHSVSWLRALVYFAIHLSIASRLSSIVTSACVEIVNIIRAAEDAKSTCCVIIASLCIGELQLSE